MTPSAQLQLAADYGMDVTTVSGALRFCRIRPTIGPRSAGEYAAIVRRLGQVEGDGRLLAVGYNCVSPTQFLELLDDWLAYWYRAAVRPETVGSNYNPSPEEAWVAYRRRLPPHAARACTAIARRRGLDWLAHAGRSEILDVARAVARTSAENYVASPRVWRALGRLCPELQRVALKGLPYGLVRYREIDWDAVASAQRLILLGVRVRAAFATGRRLSALLGGKPLCPAYPNATLELQRRLVLGSSPRELAAEAGCVLTKAEAHAWLSSSGGSVAPATWLCGEHGLPLLRDGVVVRWAVQQCARRDGLRALTRERTFRRPQGMIRVRYLDLLDELRPEDLRGSVDSTFRAATQARGLSWIEEHREDDRILCGDPWGVQNRRMRLLRTNRELIREGDEMNHCVGSYGIMVDRGECYILALRWRNHRSTAEISQEGGGRATVLQHRGPENGDPHPACEALLQSYLRRVERIRRKF